MPDTIENRIRNVIKDAVELTTPIEQVGINEDLMQLGLDSINSIKVIVVIEMEFGFEFDDEDLTADNFRTINNLISCIESRI